MTVIEVSSLPCSGSDPRRCPELVEGGVACRFASAMKREAPSKEAGSAARMKAWSGFWPFHKLLAPDSWLLTPDS